jgi:hypothetical protein
MWGRAGWRCNYDCFRESESGPAKIGGAMGTDCAGTLPSWRQPASCQKTPTPKRIFKLHVLAVKCLCSTLSQYIELAEFAEGCVLLR